MHSITIELTLFVAKQNITIIIVDYYCYESYAGAS